MEPLNLKSRYRGCLIGLASGDAYGATYEFSKPGITPSAEMRGGGPHMLKPGQWTDDTSMALCLGYSLINSKGFDSMDQLEQYVKWYRNGYKSSTGACFDVGNTTRQALEHYMSTGKTSDRPSDNNGEGNGSLMRLAPVPMFYAKDMVKAAEMSSASSITTHGSIVPTDACRYLGSMIAGLLNGMDRTDVLAESFEPEPDYWRRRPLAASIERVRHGSYRQDNANISGSGHAPKSLEAALWTFYNSDSFKDGCMMAVSLGGDTDTTSAIFGQLAGAYYGVDAIPDSWVSGLSGLEMIKSMADRLCDMAGI